MRKFLILITLVCIATTASAQLQFGLKAGVNITNMSFKEHGIALSNRTGFYVGPTMKLIAPGVGLGFDLSLLYDQRQGQTAESNNPQGLETPRNIKQQQISVPINLRWEWDFGEVLGIFIYGGPQLDMNVGKDDPDYDWRWQTAHWSANLGAGIMLVSHLQINFNYNFACNRTGHFYDRFDNSRGKFNSWQVGLAYYI